MSESDNDYWLQQRLADTEDYDPPDGSNAAEAEPGPTEAVNKLKAMGLVSVGARGWLEPGNNAPPRSKLLTTQDKNGREQLFMSRGKLAMMAAPGGTGKTQLLFQLAVAVASGVQWLQTYDVTQAGPVLLVLGEEDEDEMHRRIRGATDAMQSWAHAAQISTNLHVLSMNGKTAGMTDKNGSETEFCRTLGAGLANWGVLWSLIILDPASRFLGPEAEIDNAAATRWIEAAERLTQMPSKPSILFAHHANKGALAGSTDQGAARGSSALTDGVRLQMNLDRVTYQEKDAAGISTGPRLVDPTRVILRVVKSNYGPIPEPLLLLRDFDHGGFLAPDPFPPPPEPKASGPGRQKDCEHGAARKSPKNGTRKRSKQTNLGEVTVDDYEGDNSDCD